MSFYVNVQGREAVRRMLSDYTDPTLSKRLKVATKDGVKVFQKPLKSLARPISRRMATAVVVRVNKQKEDKPGHYVGFNYKKAYFAHMMVLGTRAHGPEEAKALVFVPGWNPYMTRRPRAGRFGTNWVRTSRVSGVRGKDIVSQVANSHEAQAYRAFEASLDKTEAR